MKADVKIAAGAWWGEEDRCDVVWRETKPVGSGRCKMTQRSSSS